MSTASKTTRAPRAPQVTETPVVSKPVYYFEAERVNIIPEGTMLWALADLNARLYVALYTGDETAAPGLVRTTHFVRDAVTKLTNTLDYGLVGARAGNPEAFQAITVGAHGNGMAILRSKGSNKTGKVVATIDMAGLQ